jgi:hypothetical protein
MLQFKGCFADVNLKYGEWHKMGIEWYKMTSEW